MSSSGPLQISFFIASSLIFFLSLIEFISSIKYLQRAYSTNHTPSLIILILYTALLPFFSLITSLTTVLYTHITLRPSPPLKLFFPTTFILLTATTLLSVLWLRCEILFPSLELPNICPSSLRSTSPTSLSSQGLETVGDAIWPAVSIFRISLTLPLIFLYILQAILATTLFLSHRAAHKQAEREEDIRRQEWEMHTFGHQIDAEGSRGGSYDRRTGTTMMMGMGMVPEKEVRVGVGAGEIRKRSRNRGVNF